MADVVVLGLQWGDEGKGKVTDELAAATAAVVRFQGGPNAGHTIRVAGQSIALHQVPSGALRAGVACIIGAGCVTEPAGLKAELEALAAAGCPLGPQRLSVAARAQVVLPAHVAIDGAEERLRGALAIGTTGRGIGPAYAAKAGRFGLTAGEFVDDAARAERLAAVRPWFDRQLAALGLPAADPAAELAALADWLRPYVRDDLVAIREARQRGTVLFEGHLGVMRDPDRGTYPWVTGASVLPPLALVGPSPRVIGVAKPYLTAVGPGPLPTEAGAAEAAGLRARGGEFGATTGRPRRVGWLDLVALRYAAGVTGATELALVKLDIAQELGTIPVCVGYRGWSEADGYPLTRALAGIEPVYEAWAADDPLALAERIAAALGLPASYVGMGPERGQGRWL